MQFRKAVALVTTALGAQAVQVEEAHGQSLQEVVSGLLANRCEGLLGADRVVEQLAPTTTSATTYEGEAGGEALDGLTYFGNPVSFSLDHYFELLFAEGMVVVHPDGSTEPWDWDANSSPFRPSSVLPTSPSREFGTSNFNVTRTITTETRQEVRSAPRDGILAAQLAAACTGSDIAVDISDAVETRHFQVISTSSDSNASEFGRVDSIGSNLFSSPGGASTSLTGSGAGLSRLQDSVVRREGGLRALMERLWRRARERANERVQVASLDESIGMTRERPYTLVMDLTGGVSSLTRDATALEGGFEADSTLAVGGAAIAFENGFLFGGALNYESTDSTQAASAAAGAAEFDAESWTGSAFAGWSWRETDFGFDAPASVSLTAGLSHGTGDQTYSRLFVAQQATTTTTTVNGAPQQTTTVTTTTHLLSDDVDRTFDTASVQIAAAQSFDWLTISPRASVTYVKVETDGHDEEGGAFALSYEDVEDEWTEARVGVDLSAAMGGASVTTIATLGVDAVFVGDAETPARTAFFVQDARSSPAAIIYEVDNLDEQFFDWNASLAFQFANGVQAYVGGVVRSGHDYLDASTAFAGVRIAF